MHIITTEWSTLALWLLILSFFDLIDRNGLLITHASVTPIFSTGLEVLPRPLRRLADVLLILPN